MANVTSVSLYILVLCCVSQKLRPNYFTNKYQDPEKVMTNRRELFKKFNANQVMLLGQILVKASKRMNAFNAEIHFQYEEDVIDASNFEVYVIPYASQRRLALKMLMKDIKDERI